jgi:hypothetical protein
MRPSSKILLLSLAGVICLGFLVALPPRTLKTVVARSQYVKNPTPENLARAEQSEREDVRDELTLRVLFALALLLDIVVIVRIKRHMSQGKGHPTH